MYLQQLDILIQ